jgi:ABC-type multidrug transport system ATPase subunit
MTDDIPPVLQDATLFLKGYYLQVFWPDGQENTFPVGAEIVRIGRDEAGNTIDIPRQYNSVSRWHVEIHPTAAGYILRDLGSDNGTYLNGERVAETAALSPGDEIRIGEPRMGHLIRMIFRRGGEAYHAAGAAGPMELPKEARAEKEGVGLWVRWPDGQEFNFPIQKPLVLIGRGPASDLDLPDELRFVSKRHAQIQRKPDGGFTIQDLGSKNGTRLNNQALAPGVPTPLYDGAVIRIGDDTYGVSVGMVFMDPDSASAQGGYSRISMPEAQETRAGALLIGRDETCGLVLPSPLVSRVHARVEKEKGVTRIKDMGSLNGTFVNQARVQEASLVEGDLVQIGGFALQYQNGELIPFQSTGMRVDTIGLTKEIDTRKGPLRIIDDIHLSILPREFVAIVGGSGAGKSTLMKAIIGSSPGTGEVLLNGQDVYETYDWFKQQIGYVPQSDILHMSLTVEKALHYAARLRLPEDLNRAEREQQVARVLETVSMNTETIRKTRIGNLSGGQRKRVSIAAELLADPRLIFLDEATSGLDPGLEKKMMHTLRRMADEGRTVILITHATANIVQADHVAFLSQGQLVYFGPSTQALDFFEVSEFADIYERIEGRGKEWRRIFREEKPALRQKYIVERQRSRGAYIQNPEKVTRSLGDFLKQLAILTQRSLSVIASEWVNLLLLMLLFPLTAMLQLVISTPDVLTGNLAILADPVAAAVERTLAYIPFPDTNIFVFVMGLEAVLVGMFVPSNELIKERSIYLRERMVNLGVIPYLLSKVLIFTLFSAVQVLLYLLVLSIGVDYPESGLLLPGVPELFITLLLTILAGNGLGLLISSLSQNTEMGIYLLTLMLFFEFFFAGTVFNLQDNPAEPLSYLTATRWSLTALGVTIDMEELVESTILCNEMPDNPLTPNVESGTVCFHYPEAREDLMLSYGDENLLQSWGILFVMMLAGIGLTGIMIKRLDKL